jgi:hypothetical protein
MTKEKIMTKFYNTEIIESLRGKHLDLTGCNDETLEERYFFVVSSSLDELMSWGKSLSNALENRHVAGRQVERIEQGKSAILGIKDGNGILCWNLSITDGKLDFIRGEYNDPAPSAIEKAAAILAFEKEGRRKLGALMVLVAILLALSYHAPI